MLDLGSYKRANSQGNKWLTIFSFAIVNSNLMAFVDVTENISYIKASAACFYDEFSL